MKRRFTQELHGPTSQKMAFFTVTTVKTSNITQLALFIPVFATATIGSHPEHTLFMIHF
jgi:hypothetical protein